MALVCPSFYNVLINSTISIQKQTINKQRRRKMFSCRQRLLALFNKSSRSFIIRKLQRSVTSNYSELSGAAAGKIFHLSYYIWIAQGRHCFSVHVVIMRTSVWPRYFEARQCSDCPDELRVQYCWKLVVISRVPRLNRPPLHCRNVKTLYGVRGFFQVEPTFQSLCVKVLFFLLNN